MNLFNKIRWLFTYVGLITLKKALGHRLQDQDGKAYLRKLPRDTDVVNRADFILSECNKKNILHIGFADHPFTEERIKDNTLLHLQLKQSAGTAWGLDNHTGAIEKYISMTGDEQVVFGDLMQAPVAGNIETPFDIVLVSEVLEHLRDPHKAVENIYYSFPAGTIFIITLPNYTSLDSFAASLHNEELTHIDHFWYFSPYTFLKMFPAEQFDLIKLVFGMYFKKSKKINFILKRFPFTGDCIIGVFQKK